jgi:glycosyltransferase involved in cell wall biosynthesis
MSRILVVTSAPPLVEGGHLVLARALVRALGDAGHETGLVTTPSNRFGRQGPAYLANWLTDVGMTGTGQRVDQIITLRFPSYAVRHPRHVCWLNHTMREYYDLWDQWSARLSPQGRVKETLRRTFIRAADTYFLKHHVKKLFTISGAVSARLTRWNGVASEVLHPPPPQRDYHCDGYGDFLFFASRLTPLKRTDLILQALAQPDARGVRLVIGGDGEDRPRLERLSRELGLDGRVVFAGQLSEAGLVDHLARCRAVVYVPANEDYGFVTVEAFASGKAVVTCTDSGGPLEFIRSRENGLIVSPDAAALAKGLAELSADRGLAEQLGARGRQEAARMTWADVVRKLVI